MRYQGRERDAAGSARGSGDRRAAREAELRAAAAVTGVRRIYSLGYLDGELDKADEKEVTGNILRIIARVDPMVVITFGPDGITGHPDHVAVGKAATRAFRRLETKDGERKLYYVTIPQSVANEQEWELETRPDEEVTNRIDISPFIDKKIQAIACHWSQQDARDYRETVKQNKKLASENFEFFFLSHPRTTTKETDLFD